ncbi:MAG: hypothetical protein IAI49_11245 [Candidatus Eremiobacteraeota bacterium]|nr:hypothetical protein [Candidatus Eremiobacteraeota bacterium]
MGRGKAMSFELTIAARKDPLAASGADAVSPAAASHTTIVLNGSFDDGASREILRTASELSERPDDSVLVRIENVEAADARSLRSFAEGVMELRRAGRNVQVVVRSEALYVTFSGLPHAHDWLVAFSQSDVDGARRALHLNHPDAE